MKDQKDIKTIDLFPEELIITKLRCTSIAMKTGKEETRVNMKLEGYTNARFETDLSNDDYLHAAAELLVKLCCEDAYRAKSYIGMIEEKYSIEDLCVFRAGAKRPCVSGGNISMTYSTAVPFDIDCMIVEKPTLIKLIAQWVMMLAKGDYNKASCAINTGYLRLVNSDQPNYSATLHHGDKSVTVSARQLQEFAEQGQALLDDFPTVEEWNKSVEDATSLYLTLPDEDTKHEETQEPEAA